MSSQRGHVLLLMMLLLAAFLAAGLLLTQRVQTRIDSRHTEEVRLQALWLARSAAHAGVSGTRRVQTSVGLATVRAAGGSVEAELAGGRATVSRTSGQERYERPGQD